MTPILYGSPASVPFRAVLMCAKALGLNLDVKHLNLFKGEHRKPNFIKKNPQHTIPLLEDNGFFLADSHAINGYLVGKYGKENDPLYPLKDLERKAIIDHRLHFDSSIIAAAGVLITRPLLLEDLQPEPKTLKHLKDAFTMLEKLFKVYDSLYVVGDTLSIADFSIIATASSWKYFFSNFESEFPCVNAYLERVKNEDFYIENLEGLGIFNSLVEAKLKK
ncbi:glutathione S-transferase 2-like [Euwallacea similis]|uniref:glutathione S-transferase 2-like n=1 Tax=Euwallacea similis TaxID=1736056 RepID=UPI00344DBDF0